MSSIDIDKKEGKLTSPAVTSNASQSMRGRIFRRKSAWNSVSSCSSSASEKWRGKEAGEALQAFMAQVRKFAVRIFMVFVFVVL